MQRCDPLNKPGLAPPAPWRAALPRLPGDLRIWLLWRPLLLRVGLWLLVRLRAHGSLRVLLPSLLRDALLPLLPPGLAGRRLLGPLRVRLLLAVLRAVLVLLVPLLVYLLVPLP